MALTELFLSVLVGGIAEAWGPEGKGPLVAQVNYAFG